MCLSPFEITGECVLVGEFKSSRWRSLLKELKKLVENLTHFYLKAELLRLFLYQENTSKTCFPPEQNKLMLETLLKCIAERSCHFMTSCGWCNPLLLGCSCRFTPGLQSFTCGSSSFLLSLVTSACFK